MVRPLKIKTPKGHKKKRVPPAKKREIIWGECVTHVYTDEQEAFLGRMKEYMRDTKVKFPAFTEVLLVAKLDGYRKLTKEQAQVYDEAEKAGVPIIVSSTANQL